MQKWANEDLLPLMQVPAPASIQMRLAGQTACVIHAGSARRRMKNYARLTANVRVLPKNNLPDVERIFRSFP